MHPNARIHRIFIATPGDLGEERRALRQIVTRLNSVFARTTDWRIELLGWEDTLPGSGRPQSLINEDLDKADLFIGCVWQKMGSPSSSHGGKTGFEEEFERATDRQSRTGSPEMWLFFKEVDAVRQNDPGEQLRRVLAFREEQVAAKKLLFKVFDSAEAWAALIEDLLLTRLLTVITARPISDEAAQSTKSGDSKPRQTDSVSASPEKGHASLVGILQQVSEQLSNGKFPSLTENQAQARRDCTRLLLLAASIYDSDVQRIQLGVHEINSVYLHRENISIMTQERLLILRTLLLDTANTKPGWFWIDTPPDQWLTHLALKGRDEATRTTAIRFAETTGHSFRTTHNKEAVPELLLGDKSTAVQIAALKYLATRGRRSDERAVEKLLTHSSKEVRIEAETSLRAMRMRHSPDRELMRSFGQADPFNDSLISVLKKCISALSRQVLIAGLNHPAESVKLTVAKELIRRSELSVENAAALIKSDSPALREVGFTALAQNGEQLNSASVRASLFPNALTLLGESRGDPDVPILAAFKRESADALWSRVSLMNEDSALALQAMAETSPTVARERITEALKDDFRTVAQKSKTKSEESLADIFARFSGPQGDYLIERTRRNLIGAALRALAITAEQSDRPKFLEVLAEHDSTDDVLVALRGLERVGLPGDRDAVRPFTVSTNRAIANAASRCYIQLTTNIQVAATDLLSSITPAKLAALLAAAIAKRDASLWKTLEPMLKNENAEVRRLACYYANAVLNPNKRKRILNAYLQSGVYYYNVVTLLDRLLYAPKSFKAHYTHEEAQFFESMARDSKYSWLPTLT